MLITEKEMLKKYSAPHRVWQGIPAIEVTRGGRVFEDEGNSFPYKLLLDERSNVSYPDAKESDDGFIYITYDRERGGFKSSLDEVYASAREILFAKITEDDIISGEVGEDSRLRQVISRLGKYEGADPFASEGEK